MNMNIPFILASIIFLAGVVLSQKLAVNAGLTLDDAAKLEIAKVFPKRNVNYTIIVFAMAIIYLILLYALPQYSTQVSVAYGVSFVIYLFAKLFLNVRKLKEIDVPKNYIDKIIFSFGVFIASVTLAAIVLVIGSSRS